MQGFCASRERRIDRLLRTRNQYRNGGMSIIYIGFALLIICFVTSLTVDVGRIRVAKGEVQTAADAAAMGAALVIPNIDLLGNWHFSNVDQTAIDLGTANL